MTTDTKNRILTYLAEHPQATPHELQGYLGIGAPALFRQLKTLLSEGRIGKAGSAPKVFYFLQETKDQNTTISLDPALAKTIQENFFTITPLGQIGEGVEGFIAWCTQHKLPTAKTAQEYSKTLNKYAAFRKKGVINGLAKFKDTFPEVYLDTIYYLDFYSIERFGKTKLGNLLLYAKQSQSPLLMRQLFALIIPRIKRLMDEKAIDAVGFIPPTIQRNLQFQKELEKSLALTIPKLTITKASGGIMVAQKTLSKLQDRIENARSTLFVENVPPAKKVLLIDDAVGSGASLNEVARKIKQQRPGVQVIGLAITGSFKGFDVLNEV